jgi:hypothetical protein
MKKADISINTIIVAAIALIVLVVLVAIFTGRMGLFVNDIDKTKPMCTGAIPSGEVKDNTEIACPSVSRIPGAYQDVDSNHVCCKKTG